MIDIKMFRETHCLGCGSQRCMGPEDEDWREGCGHWRVEKARDFAEGCLPEKVYKHSIRVAGYVRGILPRYLGADFHTACVLAFLHDVVEDTEVTIEEIETEFGEYIARSVALLSHSKAEESYPDYIDRIMDGMAFPEAKVVKHADMKDHLAQKETLTPKLKEKYFEVIDRFI
jgi:hypothetical protein